MPQTDRRHIRSPNIMHARHYSLSHVDKNGIANMVDVGTKSSTKRHATARGSIQINKETIALVKANQLKKGDVLNTARIAGIMAAKQTHNLIPLCHSLSLTKVKVDFDTRENEIVAECFASCSGQTGVEMEAMIGCSIALNTIYDMCKAADRHMVITGIQVVEKHGGKHDFKI